MSTSELEVLSRAHQLFTGSARPATLNDAPYNGLFDSVAVLNSGQGHDRYRLALHTSREVLRSAGQTDAEIAAVIAGAHQDHALAREQTKGVLDEARADASATPLTPMAQREALRRRVARLRAQRAHVMSARGQALRRAAALRALRYLALHRRARKSGALRLPPPSSRAGIAVRAALSRLGRPYVWGATGPDRFDCSGLVQWAYAQAGIHLDRTTYQQIHDGIPVARSQVRPGDLVFPHAGHVQMAIGNNLVVEAPYSGATVRISPLGANVAIRRPLL
ncbi:MAG TPA: C40 family peptidase [Mycobacterium sp.]|uniref:C40 family peptidase n=1 Tax=Mycobacterium sp. TaxID=1785 RepID=UPI002D38F240|nr:C40 family peptidase [Mycobacterium sp.]HZU50093.1 C40 family peptidase [Mycobacterium sp.]